ncbi:MAG TPA: S41 family peptidase [Pseudoflavonifractor sp.]|nr:S41 family peptidase [Pseudoflavonifractor sp.]
MREKRFSLLHIILAVVLTAILTFGGTVLAAWVTIGPSGLTLLEGMSLVNTLFVGPYDEDKVLDAAMTGMVDGLGDRWSYYLNPAAYQATNERRKNIYVGIGVTVSYENEDGLLILSVEPDGPAGKAGIQPGELILSADGTSLAGEGQSEGVTLIQGEAGTSVTLEIRSAAGETRTVAVKRSKVETNPVEYELLSDNVGYIKVKNFYDRSADGVKAAVDDLVGQGAVALVFDMRNNGGGYLKELTDMLDYLLPEGPIFRSRSRSGQETVTSSDAHCIDLPMATLVNRDTYSAAEFFGAELQEQGVGIIVGEETSGKGYSQQTFPLPGGGGLGISTGAYLTGKGTSLVGAGVKLDAELSLTEEEDALLYAGKLSHADDPQLQAALALLAQQTV